MGKKAGGFYILLLLLALIGSQEVAAQSLFIRLIKNGGTSTPHLQQKAGRYLRNQCGEMDAYNKSRAYKKHKRNRWKKIVQVPPRPTAENGPVAEKKPKNITSPPPAQTTGTPQKRNPSPNPPVQTPPVKNPPPTSNPPAPVAKKTPAVPEKADPVPVEKKDDPLLRRESLKKMTLKERRDTLLHMQPEIVLTPLQFLSDQDEFSVVNMDSFIQAMEYAQQGKVVLVEGHTDDLGSDRYNLDLSMKRAEKIRELLLSGGVSDELISVIGYGERQPLVPNISTESRSINRRIEFKIFSLPE